MDKVANLSQEERGEIFSETAARMGATPAIVEKDFWVCWVLQKIFQADDLQNKLLFKGGTSLSKVYNVIKRFSEDIDLILNWNLVSGEDPRDSRSKNKQDKFNKEINSQAKEYIASVLKPGLEELCSPLCKLVIDENDTHCVNIIYPKSFEDRYIRSEVRLEIGPLASWLPSGDFTISPYAAKYFPQLFSNTKVEVKAIEGKRTFWEKATILHQEAHRPEGKNQPSRYSRHYYDLAMLARSEIKDQALSDLELLKDVVEFKTKFYPANWAHYDTAHPGSLKLIPPARIKESLLRDYREMQDMIFGEEIPFSEIMSILGSLEAEINQQ